MAEKIQPIGLPGRWATIRAPPTTMKAVKASHSGTVSSRGWVRKSPLAAESALAVTKMAPKAASNPQATRVERLLTWRPLVGSLAASFRQQVYPGAVPGSLRRSRPA
jgi:hypothetical protein